MKRIIDRVMNEPVVVFASATAIAVAAQATWDNSVTVFIALAVAGVGGAFARSAVTPVAKTEKDGDDHDA